MATPCSLHYLYGAAPWPHLLFLINHKLADCGPGPPLLPRLLSRQTMHVYTSAHQPLLIWLINRV